TAPEPKAEATPAPAAETPAPAPAAPAAAPAAPVPPAESAETQAYKRAMREEREKRQALELRLRELQNPKPAVDPWQDLPGALKNLEQSFDERAFVERCNLTEELARSKHTDFDEVRQVFVEAANENPGLWAQIRAERNPAEYVYREGLRIKELKDVGGDFTAYKSKLEKDIEAKVRAEYEAKAAQKAA